MTLKSLGMAALALAALVTLSACHRSCGGGHLERFSGKLSKRLAKELKLDEAQKAKLEAIRSTVLEKHKDMKAGREGRLPELLALIRAERFDKAKAKALGEEHRKGWEAARETLLEQAAEFHASLTPEQREKLAKLVEKKAACFIDGKKKD